MAAAGRRSSYENNQETARLLDSESSESAEDQPVEVSPICKLKCLVLGLVIVVIGVVASLNEGTVTYQEKHNKSRLNKSSWRWYNRDNPNLWVCWAIKCIQLLMGILSVVFLLKEVMKKGYLSNLPRFQELPKKFSNYPTTMFISIFIIFAILGIVCAIAETISELINSIDPNVYEMLPYADVLRCVLLFAFILLQAWFFTKNNRMCLNWKLDGAWVAMTIILATNVSLWFFYISYEISKIAGENHACDTNETTRKKLHESFDMIVEIMFPFLIEFFLMGAILAASFLSNIGRLSCILKQLQQSVPYLTNGAEMNFKDHLRKHLHSLLLGIALAGSAILISLMMKLFTCEREPWHLLTLYILAVLFVAGSVCCVVLLRAFRVDGEAKVETKARTAADRLMLWFCVVALVVDELNRLWGLFQSDKPLYSAIGTGLVIVFDIVQSVLQVYVLECILLRLEVRVGGSPRSQGGSVGARLLTVLMVINALEWLVSAVAFSLFFFNSNSQRSAATMALVVISAPLQVFFRFHSVGCIHEFREHCREVDSTSPASR
ncbi:hypothetical protein BOX15_Mlig010166g1 [Macrostomum lignano]|uniref:Uncharacterized protein n=1 Tax=Macrostomum lignano TaxID=282301 RepID=A0A267EWP5_9PLAT|nr:hypothetical protein BOX15_Mlig010166g1 [Macrostomum lignano]